MCFDEICEKIFCENCSSKKWFLNYQRLLIYTFKTQRHSNETDPFAILLTTVQLQSGECDGLVEIIDNSLKNTENNFK